METMEVSLVCGFDDNDAETVISVADDVISISDNDEAATAAIVPVSDWEAFKARVDALIYASRVQA